MPCLLYCLGNGFCQDGFMGILEDDLFTFRIFECLFAFVGLLCGLEIDRMPQIFTPAIHGMCYRGNKDRLATVYKGNIIKNLIMDCQSYTKYRPNETTGGIFVSWRRKEELPTGA